MRLINPSVEIIPQEEGLLGVYKQIERAGRTCYKSEDKITEDSCKEFVQRMINSGHTAMLEHGTIYLQCRLCLNEQDKTPLSKYKDNKYSKCREYYFPSSASKGTYVTTNLRVLQEHDWLDDLQYLCKPTEFHEKRITVRFICDRGVSHELVRHRVFSFAQESTRYCNYSKDKFGNALTCIMPDKELWKGKDAYYNMLNCLDEIERVYMKAIEEGVTPQIARAILPNSLKTEVVMTGFVSDWQHFFDLRCAPNAHPDMQYLAKQLKEKMNI